MGYRASAADSPGEAAMQADLIVTVTASTSPLLSEKDIRPGVHITAVGSDTPDKQELGCGVLAAADVIVADSISQCLLRGEIRHAVQAGCISPGRLVELGSVVCGFEPGRSAHGQITIADLTGVAVQDIAIARAVLDALVPAAGS
jgi:ornithine cyclodeaminase